MTALFKPFVLDTLIIFFVLLMIYTGYRKGFITRLYDVITLLLSLFIAYILSPTVGKMWTIYSIEPPLTSVGESINQFVIFIILSLGFKIIFKLLGIIIKPALKGALSMLKMTKFLDHVLGVALSIIESVIIVYIALAFVFIPFFENGKETVNQSIIGKSVVSLLPEKVSEASKLSYLNNITNIDLNRHDASYVTVVTDLLYEEQKYNFVDEETYCQFVNEYYGDIEQVTLSKDTYNKLQEIVNNHEVDKNILKKITVSE